MAGTVHVEGLKELQRALAKGDKATKKEVRDSLKKSGEIVRADAQSRFGSIDTRSATGYKVRVRQRGVSVEQSRKNRGFPKRPNYTAMQMGIALIPALEENADEVVREFEKAMDDIANIIERG